jgi:hypothetical protein
MVYMQRDTTSLMYVSQASMGLLVPSNCEPSPAEAMDDEDLFAAAGFSLVDEEDQEELAPPDGVPVGAFMRLLLEQ